MQTRTEDLLSLRDGEPIDAALEARLLADPAAVQAVDALARRRQALAAMREEPPPEGARERVLAAMQAAAGNRRSGALRRLVVLATAASVAAAAVWLVLDRVAPADRGTVPSVAGPAPAADDEPMPAAADAYFELVRESARLENLLVALPAQRDIMTAGTAGTIASLEDQIALIDARLTQAAAAGADADYRSALWRERVNVMSALVQVRYAQSQIFVF